MLTRWLRVEVLDNVPQDSKKKHQDKGKLSTKPA
jgi:hypothetical protein